MVKVNFYRKKGEKLSREQLIVKVVQTCKEFAHDETAMYYRNNATSLLNNWDVTQAYDACVYEGRRQYYCYPFAESGDTDVYVAWDKYKYSGTTAVKTTVPFEMIDFSNPEYVVIKRKG